MDKDCVVWAVDIDDAHRKLPKALAAVLAEEGASVFTVDLLSEFSTIPIESLLELSKKKVAEIALNAAGIGGSLSIEEVRKLTIRSVSDLSKLDKKPVCFFLEPPSIDGRVVNQFALFSIVSDPMLTIDAWLAENQIKTKKLLIPANLKWQIRDRLDQSNISERTIYPGLEGISKWLKRHYSPNR